MSTPTDKPATQSTISLDFEPDQRWKDELRQRIEVSLSPMVEKAKQDFFAKPRDQSLDESAIDGQYHEAMRDFRRLAEEQYQFELERERQERKWTAGQNVDQRWSEALMKEQQAILDIIKRNGQPQSGKSTSEDAIPNDKEPVGISPLVAQPQHESTSVAESVVQERARKASLASSNSIPEDSRPPPSSLDDREVSHLHSVYPRQRTDDRVRDRPVSIESPPKTRPEIWVPAAGSRDGPTSRTLAHASGSFSPKPRRDSSASIGTSSSIPATIPEYPASPETNASHNSEWEHRNQDSEPMRSGISISRSRQKARKGSSGTEERFSLNQLGTDSRRVDEYAVASSPTTSVTIPVAPFDPRYQLPITIPNRPAVNSRRSFTEDSRQVQPQSSRLWNPPSEASEPKPIRTIRTKQSFREDDTVYPPQSSPISSRWDVRHTPIEENRAYASVSSSPQDVSRSWRPVSRPVSIKSRSSINSLRFRPPAQTSKADVYTGSESESESGNEYEWRQDELSQRESYTKKMEEVMRKREDAQRREEELGRKEEELRLKEEEALKKENEFRLKHEEIKRKEEEFKLKEETVRLQEEEVRKKEEEFRQKEEEAKRKKEEASRKEAEALRKEQEVIKKEQEAARKAEARLREIEYEQKEREAKRAEEESRKREAEARKKEEEALQKEEEIRQKEEDVKRIQKEAQQKQKEIEKKEEEARRKEAEAKRQAQAAKEKEEATRKREQAIKNKEELLKKKEKELKSREAEMQSKEEQIREDEEEVRRARQDSISSDNISTMKEEEIKRKEEQLERREADLHRREGEIRLREEEEAKRREEEEQKRREEEEKTGEQRRRESGEQAKLREEESRRRALEAEAKLKDEAEVKQREQEDQEVGLRKAEQEEADRREALRLQEEWRKEDLKRKAEEHRIEAERRKEEENARKREVKFREEQRRAEEARNIRQTPISPSGSFPTVQTTFSDYSSTKSSTTPSRSSTGWTSSSSRPASTASSQTSSSSRPIPIPPSSNRGSAASFQSSSMSEEEWARRQAEHAQRQQEQFRKEQERIERERHARQAKVLSQKDIIQIFQEHERQWERIRTLNELEWHSFPWPMFRRPFVPEDLTGNAIGDYVLYPDHPKDKSKASKERIKDHIKRWHPDRFETTLLTKVKETDKEKVKEGAGLVARNLNHLLTRSNLDAFS